MSPLTHFIKSYPTTTTFPLTMAPKNGNRGKGKGKGKPPQTSSSTPNKTLQSMIEDVQDMIKENTPERGTIPDKGEEQGEGSEGRRSKATTAY